MPAFAPLLRPVAGGGLAGLSVAVAIAAAAVGGAVAEVVRGGDADGEADEDVAAAAVEADHVVAERSDL